jgi:hypothetical protein
MVKDQCLVIAKIPVLKRSGQIERASTFVPVPGSGTQFWFKPLPLQMLDENVAGVRVCTKLKVVFAGVVQSVWYSKISIRGAPSA